MRANYTYKDGITVNAYDGDTADEKHEKIKKCQYCGGKGLVQICENVRGLNICPYCKLQK